MQHSSLEQLVKVRSQLAEGMMEYFQLVMDAPDRPELLPAYLGERTRTALYVSPDVLKHERRAEPLAPPSALGQREDERARRSAEGETRPRTRFAAEAQEIGEEAIYGERERETERRVAWAEERKELGRGLSQRAVVLAPPGQGKSLLTQMTACDVAKEAREALLTERLSADAVPLPVVVTLNALTGDGVRAGATPEEALRRALATALRELGCPEIAVKYLAEHAHENRCWLFLDALDVTAHMET